MFSSRPPFAPINARRLRGALTLAVALGLGVTAQSGCTQPDVSAASAMAGPAGMAVAGRAFDKVFVAMRGRDAVQVLDATGSMGQIDFVRAPALYFPLHLPVGPNPSEVAASRDGAHVFVLDGITSQVGVIDADALRVRQDASGAMLVAAVGPREAQPTRMVGHPWPTCRPSEATDEVCLARAYVTLQNLGSVAAVDLRQLPATGALRLHLDRLYPVGGTPTELAAHPTQPVLFVADAASGEVVRLPVAGAVDAEATEATDAAGAGSILRLAVGQSVGPLAVSGDGTALLVGRPAAEDVVVVTPANASPTAAATERAQALAQSDLRVAPQQIVSAPVPQCLAVCDAAGTTACTGAHPADAALCLTPTGYAAVPAAGYAGLWLQTAPQAIAALSQSRHGEALAVHCGDGAASTQRYAEAFAVAGFDGSLRYVALVDGGGNARIVDTNACRTPSVQQPDATGAGIRGGAEQILADLEVAEDLPSRVHHLAFAPDQPAKVGLLRSGGGERTFALSWEGTLPGGDRTSGTGAIDADGRFFDVGDLASGSDPLAKVAILARTTDARGQLRHRGDVLEILTPSLDDDACQASEGGANRLCALERRIVALTQDGATTRLVLDRPLHAECFRGPIPYRIRAGDAFLVGEATAQGSFVEAPVRLAPGETYGPGRHGVDEENLFFTVAADLPIDADAPACRRYVDNRAAADAPPWRSRLERTLFTLRDPYASLQAARRSRDGDGQRQQDDRIGALPHAVLVAPATNGRPARLWLSFAASGSVFVADPFDTQTVGIGEHGRLLQ